MNSRTKFTILTLGVAIYIVFPFFKIKYFETHTSLIFIKDYLLRPIILLAFTGITFLYFKFLKKFNPATNSKTIKIAQDSFNILLEGIALGGVIFGIVLSTIITTNAYLGTPKDIEINTEVLNYITSKTKFGRITHHIEFKNPNDGEILRLEVYKKYNIGDTFRKNMKIGYWNKLYSIN